MPVDKDIRKLEAWGQAYVTSWKDFAGSDSGIPVMQVDANDRSVQVTGLTGGTITIQGSNDYDPVTSSGTWHTLTDAQDNPLTFSTSGIKVILEMTKAVRPLFSAAVGPASVYIYSRGQVA